MAVWVAVVSVVVAASEALGANLSTSALLLALGTAPAILAALRARGRPAPSRVRTRHSVETKEGRP